MRVLGQAALRVGLVIIGLLLAAFFGAMAIAVIVQIARHPWVLLISCRSALLLPCSTAPGRKHGSNAKADRTRLFVATNCSIAGVNG